MINRGNDRFHASNSAAVLEQHACPVARLSGDCAPKTPLLPNTKRFARVLGVSTVNALAARQGGGSSSLSRRASKTDDHAIEAVATQPCQFRHRLLVGLGGATKRSLVMFTLGVSYGDDAAMQRYIFAFSRRDSRCRRRFMMGIRQPGQRFEFRNRRNTSTHQRVVLICAASSSSVRTPGLFKIWSGMKGCPRRAPVREETALHPPQPRGLSPGDHPSIVAHCSMSSRCAPGVRPRAPRLDAFLHRLVHRIILASA